MDGKTAHMLYARWYRTAEAKQLRAPGDYNFVRNHPNNFKRIREAFHVYCITQKILESA